MSQVLTHAAKITRPKVAGIYLRLRLFELFDTNQQSSVTWITSPPGAGKTTLVSSYIETRQTSVLWYQVDEGDADLSSFFYYLGLAAKKATPRKRKQLPLLTPEYKLGIPTFTRNFFRALYAADQGKAMEFCLSAHTARFSEGLDLGDDKVIGDIAEQCALNPQEAVNASNDRKYHHRVLQGMSKAREIGLFGVPFFIYKDNKYWGNDRIEWLLRDVYADMDKAVPDLSSAPMLRPF